MGAANHWHEHHRYDGHEHYGNEHHDRYDNGNDGYHHRYDNGNHRHYYSLEPDGERKCKRKPDRERIRECIPKSDRRYDGYRYSHHGYLNWDDNRSEHHRSSDRW
jgi:hypothetical protein